MARRFQTGDSIIFPTPAALNGTDGGPRTILKVAKLNTSAYQGGIYTRSAGAHGWWTEYDTTGGLHMNYGTGTTARAVGTVSTGAWQIATARKDDSGSVNPIGRHLTGAGFTTDGGDVVAASTLIDGTAIDLTYGVQVGRWGNTGTDFSSDIEYAYLAVWNSLLAGATLVGLTTQALILAASPDYWISFEGTTATDSVSGSPTITGTTTTADPSGFFSAAAAAASPQPLVAPSAAAVRASTW